MRIIFNRNKKSAVLIAVIYLLAGCDAQQATPVSLDAPPVTVATTTLTSQPVIQVQTYPGRVSALRTAQIRPQVSGIITDMSFSQGSEVLKGQVLFQIDPAPFRAEVNSALAALAKAEANYRQLQSRAVRIEKLSGSGAISQQDNEDAASNALQAKASVAEARASLARKQLELSYATVKAPIAGRIDQSFVTEGALVSSTEPQAMATVQQIDNVYVDVRQPAAALYPLSVQPPSPSHAIQADILSASGESISHSARILFTGVSVDPGTGDVVMRLEVANPQRVLLPGMYVQAKISQPLSADGILIPQQAVVRGGETTRVWLDDDGYAKEVTVVLGDTLNGHYFVRAGLKAGDRLITQGMGKLQEGLAVKNHDEPPRS